MGGCMWVQMRCVCVGTEGTVYLGVEERISVSTERKVWTAGL